MTQTFTESGISTTYHSKGQESPVRVQPFYVIRNNEVLWSETYQRFTLSCFFNRDWLSVAWVYLSAILLVFSISVTRLLLFSWIETRKASVKSRITLNWLSLRPPNIAEISNHATFVCASSLEDAMVVGTSALIGTELDSTVNQHTDKFCNPVVLLRTNSVARDSSEIHFFQALGNAHAERTEKKENHCWFSLWFRRDSNPQPSDP